MACNLAGSEGSCANVPNNTDPANECVGATACNGAGACVPLVSGVACTLGAECASGNCVDGVCCNSACGGTCMACNLAGSQGTCSNVPDNTDPANECVGATSCNGAGACGSLDLEPGNNTCAGALMASLPAALPGLQLPTVADVDWFMFPVGGADVGKLVHVVTTGSGNPACDTVVEVFTGSSCLALVSLGGPSNDVDYSENWLSSAIPALGQIWVKVSYSTFGFSSAPYALSVTLQ
jgi:hypothetical protein